MVDRALKGKSILIVEDDPLSQLLMKEIFRSTESLVTVVSTGNQAIEYCECHPEPNFMMLDLKLPDMDGFELVRRIRQQVPGTKIFAVTACVYGDISDRCAQVGMQGFIPKPLVINDMLDLMARCN